MIYTRKVIWESTKEYGSIEEAKADEDKFLRDTSPNRHPNFELYDNTLEDESGCPVDVQEIGR